MKKLIITVVIISLQLFISSCTDDTPSCIEDRIEEFTSQNAQQSFTFIYEFEQDGNQYYIFDNGIAFDAIAEVFDEVFPEQGAKVVIPALATPEGLAS